MPDFYLHSESLLEIESLKKYFTIKRGIFGKTVDCVRAVDGISLRIGKGESLGLVGESGCGKSTIGGSILKLLEPTGGKILFVCFVEKASLIN